MHLFQRIVLIWLIPIISCSSFLRNSGILSIIHSGTNNSSSSNTLSSIQVLSRKKKEASPEILLAIKQCENAILRPKNDEMLKGPSFCLGLLKQSLGDLEGALVDYQRALLGYPKNGAASYNIGGIFENLGRDIDAAVSYKNAMALNETYEAAFSRLIPLLLRNNEVNEARIICIDMSLNGPSTGRYLAYQKLGATLHKMGLKEESLSAYESALKICNDPLQSSDLSEKRHVEALNNAAQAASVIISAGNSQSESAADIAEKYFQKSIQTNAENADTHTYYGVFLKNQKRMIEAADEFRLALALDPTEKCSETGYAAVQLASIVGGSSQTKMSQNYICSLFDGYADRFDHELVVTLDYRGHEQVVNAMINAMNINNKVSINSDNEIPVLQSLSSSISDSKRLDVIDLGSGTGLCGALIRKLIPDVNVYGVDLSQRMLEKAVERGCYNSLILGDAEEYLLSCGFTVDAIIAADVFIYIGDLLKIMKASYSALKSKGFLVFTIEELNDPLENISNLDLNTQDDDSSTLNEKAAGVRLLSSGRFGHTEKYIRKLAADLNFTVITAKKEVLRLQSEIPVKSITFTVQK